MPYVSDVMRYLMYHNGYAQKQAARQFYSELPPKIRNSISSIDYSRAEKLCPQKMPIARLMAEAARKLT